MEVTFTEFKVVDKEVKTFIDNWRKKMEPSLEHYQKELLVAVEAFNSVDEKCPKLAREALVKNVESKLRSLAWKMEKDSGEDDE